MSRAGAHGRHAFGAGATARAQERTDASQAAQAPPKRAPRPGLEPARATSLDPVVCRGHTPFMKVAVSIPDPIFRAAERVSRRTRVPRSQLYADAIEAYLRERSGEDITERLNEVYARTSPKLDPAAEAVSLEILRREKW
jgi:hypothetical protein